MSVFRSPSLSAALSFVLPGLGQLATGAVVRALLVALPAVGLAVAAVAILATAGDSLTDLLLDPSTLTVLLILNAALALYHVVAIVDAWRMGVRASVTRRASRRSTAVLAGLLVLTLAGHGWLEYVGIDANTTLDTVFAGGGGDSGSDDGGDGMIPEPSFSDEPDDAYASDDAGWVDDGGWDDEGDPNATDDPNASFEPEPSDDLFGSDDPNATDEPDASPGPDETAAASSTPGGSSTPAASPSAGTAPTGSASPGASPGKPTPAPTPVPAWARDGRLNLLLVGADAGPDRWSLRTDTMIVLSVAVKTGRAAMFGIPRNLVGAPLAPESAGAFKDGHFPQLLNALYVYAMAHPEHFPGGQNRGFRAVAGAVQELIGERLDGMIVVNLAGFVTLVEEMGGLWIDIPERLYDRNYPLEDGSGHITIDFQPGCQHLDGRMALAYARSRHQDSDYGRMRRQQEVLIALRRQIDPASVIPRIPALLKIARDNLWTTLKRKDLASMARLATHVNTRRIRTITFVPPRYSSQLDEAEIARIRTVVRNAVRGPLPPLLPEPDGKRCR